MKECAVLRGFGWFLVIGSFPVWFALFAAPFLPLPAHQRVIAGGVFAGLGEAMFWLGGAILGAAVVGRFRLPKVRTGRSFVEKKVGVVGATGGLGQAIVKALRREGAEVFVLGRNKAQLEKLGADLDTTTVELTSRDSLEKAAQKLSSSALDSLIFATGMDIRKPLAKHSLDEINEEVAVDLVGPILGTQAFLPIMAQGGSIVFLGGFADGRLALPYYSVDVAARSGLAAFCESMNRELALENQDVRLCYLCPAPTDTEAERPYLKLWRKMGSRPITIEKSADFILAATLARRPRAVMGLTNRLIARINSVWPGLADVLGIRRASRHLQDAFSEPSLST